MHEIRLAGPWDIRHADANTWEKTTLPVTSESPSTPVTLRRKFHRPTGLEPSTQLRLRVVANQPHGLTATLNGETLTFALPTDTDTGDTVDAIADITQQTTQFNDLQISLAEAQQVANSILEVKLQIIESGHSG